MQDIEQIIDRYLTAWNTIDSERRSTVMREIVAEDCYYADAHLPDPLIGRELHDRFITQFRDKFPDFSLKLAAPAQAHHSHYRFGWQLLKSDGSIFTKGMYCGEINGEGKICKIIGFID
jgi:hypothetical protein